MMLRRGLLVAGVLLAVALPATARSQVADPDEVADVVSEQGFYVEPGRTADESRLDQLVRDTSNRGYRVMYVVLADTPPGGATTFADAVLDSVASGTVVVVTPDELGYSSVEFDSDELNFAADASLDDFGADPVTGFTTFTETLVGGEAGAEGGETAARGGSGVLVLLLLGAGAVVLFLMFSRRRARKTSERDTERRLAEAKQEIQGQLASLANGILELSDRVTMSGSEQAEAYYHQANETYAAATDEVERIESLPQLEALADRLDKARWQLEAAKAVMEDRPLPPEPQDRPASCFFDPTHGAGVEEAEIQTAAGSRKVGVCAKCADDLRRGERPTPRTISVDGVPVPAARAPRYYGGGGYDALDVFSVLTGAGAPLDYEWGPMPYPYRRRRSIFWGGGYGGGWGGGYGGGFGGYGGGFGGYGGGFGGGGWGGGGFGGGRRGGFGGGRGRGGMRLGGRGRGGRRL